MQQPAQKNMKTVYTVTKDTTGKSHWVKLGVGFTNRDGSLTLRLDGVPINGELQVRDYQTPEEREAFFEQRRTNGVLDTRAELS